MSRRRGVADSSFSAEAAPLPASVIGEPRDAAARPVELDAAAHPGRLLRTTILVTIVYCLGSVLGLVRDMLIAHYFGASPATDAFLVAWTIPETVTPVLAEGVLIYLLVPIISRELELGGSPQRVLDRTLLPTIVSLAALAAVTALVAPVIVAILGPGLADPDLAVRCTRAAAVTVLFLGLAGYMTATLRATGSFLLPTWIYVVYNVGIVAMMVVLHERLGVYSAAIGLAVGSAGVVVLLSPAFLGRVRLRTLRLRFDRRLLLGLSICVPIVAYTLGRQAQVWAERPLGSLLDPGAISHLNYAAKVAQIPMVLAGTVVLVAMPSLARHAAASRTADFRTGVERSLRLGMLLVVPATAALVVFAPQVVEVLFLRGAFTAEDADATSDVMRVYSVGLLGQLVVGSVSIYFWSGGRRTWYPATAMLVGLVATVVISAVSLHTWQAAGIALGNAVGISVTAVLLLEGLRRRVIDIAMRRFLSAIGLSALAALAAGMVAWPLAQVLSGDLPEVAVALLGSLVLVVVYTGVLWVMRIEEVRAAVVTISARLRGSTTAPPP